MFIPDPDDLIVIRKLDFRQPSTWLVTWGGLGFLRPAPGTWGSLGAIPFGLILYSAGGIFAVLAFLALVIYVGLKAIDAFQKRTETHDNRMVVIDEVAGQLIALLPTAMDPFLVFLSFILFRVFDIMKPGPIRKAEQMPGSRGVMADDLLAGAVAALCILVLRYAGFG